MKDDYASMKKLKKYYKNFWLISDLSNFDATQDGSARSQTEREACRHRRAVHSGET
jgi:hypothetical protein